jgi:hypothetical protein
MIDPAVWRDLALAFQQLAFKYGDRLTPSWRSTPWNDAGDHWHVFRRVTDDARERHLFISLAKRAGVHLGGGQVEPLFAWLDHLRLKSANFIGGHAEGDVGEFEFGTILQPCQASAGCCFDLETDSMVPRNQEEASRNDGPQSRNGLRRNAKYEEIDTALREIAAARPKNHEEVFRFLSERKVVLAHRKPFKTAGGWLKGFKENPHAASAWLSQAWGRLGLPAFARGPKK